MKGTMTDHDWRDLLRLLTSTGLLVVKVDRDAGLITLRVPPVKR